MTVTERMPAPLTVEQWGGVVQGLTFVVHALFTSNPGAVRVLAEADYEGVFLHRPEVSDEQAIIAAAVVRSFVESHRSNPNG